MATAFQPADILIPDCKKIDMEKWSVVACDQYTAEPEYWAKVEETVDDAKSTLRLILPEVYLKDGDVPQRTEKIGKAMETYLSEDFLKMYPNSMVYVERVQHDGRLRQGLVGKIDLEQYDYNKGSVSSVRATEATVLERIPPRVKIRENAPMELPHIMILIDDSAKTVVEPLEAQKNSFEKVYDFPLMCNGGKIAGYVLTQEAVAQVTAALEQLDNPENFAKKYNLPNQAVLTYAMGDGNHSLATAKACYENLKAAHPEQDFSNHPARYALVEIVNLHSSALEFEAIHRIVDGVDTKKFMSEMTTALGLTTEGNGQKVTILEKGSTKELYITKPTSNLTVGSVQNFIDSYLKANGGSVDYIHGIDVVTRLAQEDNAIGMILPDMDKSELFPTVIQDGSLPRKTFSMGHAEDKRFYLECRTLTK